MDGDTLDLAFTGDVISWRGPAPFYFVEVPGDLCEIIGAVSSMVTYGWGVIPVQVQIGGTDWTTSLFPEGRPVPRAAQGRRAQGRGHRPGRRGLGPADHPDVISGPRRAPSNGSRCACLPDVEGEARDESPARSYRHRTREPDPGRPGAPRGSDRPRGRARGRPVHRRRRRRDPAPGDARRRQRHRDREPSRARRRARRRRCALLRVRDVEQGAGAYGREPRRAGRDDGAAHPARRAGVRGGSRAELLSRLRVRRSGRSAAARARRPWRRPRHGR